MVKESLLKLREMLKQKRPRFRRQEAHRHKRLTKSGWRRPRGAQSKLRRYHKGKGTRARIGYGGPKAVRGLTSAGKKPVLIVNVSELNNLDKTRSVIIISSKVGMKKRLEIARQASKLGLEIQNIDVKTYEELVKSKLAKRKEKRKVSKARTAKKKKKGKKEEKKKAEEKKEKEKKTKEKEKPVKKEEKKETKKKEAKKSKSKTKPAAKKEAKK